MTTYAGSPGVPVSPVPRDDGIDVAAAAARRVVSALLHVGADGGAPMADIARDLDRIADQLEEHAPERQERVIGMWAGRPRHDPVTGPENALAPPVRLHGLPDGSVTGTVTLGLPYQGPPGCVHGGISALLLDHALGVANSWGPGPDGMTGTLSVRYHRTAPLFEELTIRARQESSEGRRIRTTGEILAGGRVCVSADGIFVAGHVARPVAQDEGGR
ncbi:PaaI family thioesterase [Amycolatopsis echigonensis]|uniref:Acyl-coenzyme A thioesterase THEM4 n=1 Tax=Amycolatopsis echigonensis TaxID=2576905 RepID=A0A2N3WR18_9PSEU|nr:MULTISPECIES: PaaI family thioesterase [Amycolatopsis]MBB2502849.1 PaaI family thioesterase [Amycolatopsis echigonensis]PKV96299.1 thioesterase superfamily protein [Amycolatopsis niigatensis]